MHAGEVAELELHARTGGTTTTMTTAGGGSGGGSGALPIVHVIIVAGRVSPRPHWPVRGEPGAVDSMSKSVMQVTVFSESVTFFNEQNYTTTLCSVSQRY